MVLLTPQNPPGMRWTTGTCGCALDSCENFHCGEAIDDPIETGGVEGGCQILVVAFCKNGRVPSTTPAKRRLVVGSRARCHAMPKRKRKDAAADGGDDDDDEKEDAAAAASSEAQKRQRIVQNKLAR